MWASFTRVRADPARTEEAIDLVRRHLVPEFVGSDGSQQGYWMLDRTTGTGLVVRCWRDLAALEAGRSGDGAARTTVIERLDAMLCETGTYEVHGLRGASAPIDGGHAWSRVTFVEGVDPVALLEGHDLYERTYEQVADQPGFLSLCWLVDPDTGNGMSISTWRTDEDLRASGPHGRRLRRRVARALGCRVEDVVDVETIGTARYRPAGATLDLRDGAATTAPEIAGTST
jgi:heme-degrading monooxygenase HmoA